MMKFRCIPVQSQVLLNENVKQKAIAKNKNFSAAEAEMDKVKPVTPYVASAYLG